MTNSDLVQIVAELRNQQSRAEAELNQVKQQGISVQAKLTRIRKALLALTEGAEANNEKPPANSANKPAANKQDVINAVVQCLTNHDELPIASLRDMASEIIVQQGKTRMGFGLRFKEAIADPRFQRTDSDLVKLSNA